jgi:triosephosphate isomerase
MNLTITQARNLAQAIVAAIVKREDVEVLVCPAFTALDTVAQVLRRSGIALGAQNMYFEHNGAFTGEVSAAQLLDVGCTYVILGHSERRRLLGETSEMVNQKLKAALSTGLRPIVCVGETTEERNKGQTELVIRRQVTRSLGEIDPALMKKVCIAYEPVWAIGTGKVATPDLVEDVHGFIRENLPSPPSDEIRILYGGSVTAENAHPILAQPNVDGALVGGASLKPDSFAAIVAAASEQNA